MLRDNQIQKDSNELLVFVSHSFQLQIDQYKRDEYRAAVRQLLSQANEAFAAQGLAGQLKAVFEFSEYQVPFSEQLMGNLRRCEAALVDLSDNNLNVMFELGFLSSRDIPTIITRVQKAKETHPLPSDLADKVYCEYESADEIVAKCLPVIISIGQQLLQREVPSRMSIENIWFPSRINLLHVIGPPSYDEIASTDINSPNFIYLDQFGPEDYLSFECVFPVEVVDGEAFVPNLSSAGIWRI